MKSICNHADFNCIRIDVPCRHATLHDAVEEGYHTCMNSGGVCKIKGKEVKCVPVDVVSDTTEPQVWN